MAQLTDTQLVILSAAIQRPDRSLLPLPERLKGGAAQKVVTALLAKGLADEVEAGHGDPVWREAGDRRSLTLVATDAAFTALGLEAPGASQSPAGAQNGLDAGLYPSCGPELRT